MTFRVPQAMPAPTVERANVRRNLLLVPPSTVVLAEPAEETIHTETHVDPKLNAPTAHDASYTQMLVDMNDRLRDLTNFTARFNRFSSQSVYVIDSAQNTNGPVSASGYAQAQALQLFKLHDRPIHSVYIENGTTQQQSLFVGTQPDAGKAFTQASPNTWRIMPVGDSVYSLAMLLVQSVGLIRIVVTEQYWTPNMGNIL